MSQQLKTYVRNAQLEADVRNAELAELAELKEKLEQKDKFILEYWEMMKNLLIAERKMNKELQATNTELQATNTELQATNTDLNLQLDWYHKQCSRERSCATKLTVVNW
jgi:hypothetical protein